jgi:hypothetical protein
MREAAPFFCAVLIGDERAPLTHLRRCFARRPSLRLGRKEGEIHELLVTVLRYT